MRVSSSSLDRCYGFKQRLAKLLIQNVDAKLEQTNTSTMITIRKSVSMVGYLFCAYLSVALIDHVNTYTYSCENKKGDASSLCIAKTQSKIMVTGVFLLVVGALSTKGITSKD